MNVSNLVAIGVLVSMGALSSSACDDSARVRAPALVSAATPALKAPALADAAPPVDAAREEAASSPSAFQAWRERVPLVESDSACVPALNALAKHDPAMLLALGLVRWKKFGKGAACATEARVVEALRNVDSSAVLFDVLRDPSRWRFEADVRWADAAREIVELSDQLLPKASAADLISLLGTPRFTDDALRSGLLVAVRSDTPGRRDLYRDWAPRLERPDPRFAREFLREFPLALMPEAWLLADDDTCDQDLARAVFESVRRTDTTAATELFRMLETRTAHFHARPVAFGFFIDALVRLGAPQRTFSCRKELPEQRCRMISVGTGDRIDAAVATCVTAARAWLGPRAAPGDAGAVRPSR